MRALEINEVVLLRRDLPEQGLARGALGTVVAVFDRPRVAYEVEFCDAQGRTLACVALVPEEIELPPG